jgi:hypothetical protein
MQMTPTKSSRPIAVLAGVTLLGVGCKPPPDAPAKLEALCDYIFAHADDDDPEAVIAGLENLNLWLEEPGNLESTAEGYTISTLNKSSVEDLKFNTNNTPNVSDLIGAAVAVRHNLSMKEVATTTVVDDWEKVAEGNYDEYRRNFGDQNPSCFPKKNCELLTASSYSSSKWAGLIEVESKNKIDFRWFHSEELNEWFLVQRSWLTEPATVTPDTYGIDVQAQYFLATTAKVDGTTVRMMATWIDADYGALPISEDGAKSQIVKSMQKQGEQVDEWNE